MNPILLQSKDCPLHNQLRQVSRKKNAICCIKNVVKQVNLKNERKIICNRIIKKVTGLTGVKSL